MLIPAKLFFKSRLSVLLLGVLYLAISCHSLQETPPSGSTTDTNNQDAVRGATQNKDLSFTREDAENLLAMYYGRLNKEAKYPRFKGLEISILNILPLSVPDSFQLTSIVTGRIWERPKSDTTTIAFRDTLSFLVFRAAHGWDSDLKKHAKRQ